MPKPGAPTSHRGATPLRDMLIARWDNGMARWRIPGHVYPLSTPSRSSRSPVAMLWSAASGWPTPAGPPASRVSGSTTGPSTPAPDAGKTWLLGADDTLTLIEDHHVAEFEQRDFDELVEGLGPSRTLAGDADDSWGAVELHAAWTRGIRENRRRLAGMYVSLRVGH